MANVTQLFQTVAAELEWAFLVRFSKASREQDLYALWARKRRELFRKWGNLPTIGNENRRIESLKNKYKGERIFIIGNGPSLNDTPLEKLEGEYTFGVNRIYLLFNRISWRPSFYTINDWEVGPDNAGEIEALEGMTFFFPKRFKGLFEQTDSTYWYNSRHARFKGDDFSYDLTDGAVMGGSVLPLAIQIAYYMGFDPIYLIGVDVNYKIPDTVKQSGTKRFADGNLQFLRSTKDDDCNHFDSSYFGKGRRWHNPNTERMIEGFRVCREAIEGQGGHIYNATVGGKLEVMERVDFNSIFEQEFNPPPKVSIVMPAHDAEPFIGEAINSVLAQTYQSWELIIVNDGSQDNTKQIIESFQDSRIICIDQENAGRPNARNTALKHVRGEYVTFLDADDFYESNNLELQVKFLQENKYAGAVVGSVKRVAENGRAIKINIRPDGQPIPTKSFLIGNPAHLQSTMFRRQWVNPSVLFNPEARAGEDWEFNIQRALAGCTFVKQSAVICSYRCTERAKHKTTEPYAEAMAAVIDRIFDSMAPQSIYKEMEDLARYHVNLRIATRFFSTEQYELGQKYFLKALKYTDRFNDNFYESVSNNLFGWLIQLDTKKPNKVLKAAIGCLPDTLDKKQIERRSLSKLRKNFILRSGIGSSFFHNRQLRKSSDFDKVAAIASRLINSKSQEKSTNRLKLNTMQLAISLLGRVARYYSRWPVILAVIAIALNTAAMFDVPLRWALMMGGTSILLFLVGHAASKADFALEAADKAHSRASFALKTGDKAFKVASQAPEAHDSTPEVINPDSPATNSSKTTFEQITQYSSIEQCQENGPILKTTDSRDGSEFP
ncbi:MAG: hypothetical protein BRC41_03995 [Cyanobacteria bacterium QH_9_48_43]|nr:MAG: hypothetical protein BRC41_03995 [Cyanobacteria bacterium QH_9_48_43]